MSISKRKRFEVFKRDNFTCQYCGNKAPDVLLHADHIQPQSKGGKDTLLNLTTACEACNSGKSDKALSDDSAVTKQRTQLDQLQERQEQIAMMVQWQRGLSDLDMSGADQAVEFWSEQSGYNLNETGRKTIKRLLRKFGLQRLLEAMRISAESYIDYDDDGEATQASVEIAVKKLGGICAIREAEKEKPYLRDVYYIKGICRNRFSYVDHRHAKALLESAFNVGGDVDEIRSIALNAKGWADWRTKMYDYINGIEPETWVTTNA